MKPLRLLLALGLAWAAVAAATAAPRGAAEIRKDMAAVRRSTNWGDPAAAKTANERIAKLAEELALSGQPAPATAAADSGTSTGTADPNEGGFDGPRYQYMLGQQIAVAVGRGEHGDILLATSVREQIVKEYRDDLDPQIKNPDLLGEMRTLVIDLSSPAAPGVIAQMENFRGIKTLVITGGKSGAPVDLPMILRKAARYPLEELYIVNFQHYVTELPSEVGRFGQLRLLAAFNNGIVELPPQLASLTELETLFVDANPIRSVLPAAGELPKLARLGVGRTEISDAERAEIHRLLPGCSILTK